MASSVSSKRRLLHVAFGVFSLLLPACSMVRLKEDLAEYSQFATIQGTITSPFGVPFPICVAAVTNGLEGPVVRAYDVLSQDPHFIFKVPPGKYTVIAYHDPGTDLTYRIDQPAGALDSYFDATPGALVTDLTVQVQPHAEAVVAKLVQTATAHKDQYIFIKNSKGERIDFKSDNFSRASAAVGFWEPVHFLTTIDSGVFFAEPFEPDKTPVLFVHGANGTPLDFQTLSGRLDSSRYQAWFAYYPSGLSLEISAIYLKRTLAKLQHELGFRHVDIIAHSMGGLVARRMILELAADGYDDLVSHFISISSPWSGHVAAGLGVEHSPEIVPSWRDIAPGSTYLVELFKQHLPRTLNYSLLFGYRGETSLIMANNDGVVELSSVLRAEAQDEAKLIRGFNASHTGILELPEVANEIAAALAGG